MCPSCALCCTWVDGGTATGLQPSLPGIGMPGSVHEYNKKVRGLKGESGDGGRPSFFWPGCSDTECLKVQEAVAVC